jgi:C4-dicarboxylate-specific signal transduction histidine kinase
MALPLRRQVTLLLVVVLLPVLAGFGLDALLTYREQLAALQREATATLSSAIANLNRSLNTADTAASLIETHPVVQSQDEAAIAALLPQLRLSPTLANVLVADPEGRVFARVGPISEAAAHGVDPAWLRDVVASGRSSISQLIGAGGTDAHALVLGYPLRDAGGRATGVLGLVLHLDAVERILAALTLPEGSVVTVTDRNSIVVARSRDSRRYAGRQIEPLGTERPPDAVPAQDIRTGIDGVERVFANTAVARGPFLVSVGIPTAVAWARAQPLIARDFLTVATVLAVLLGAAAYVGVRWVGGLSHLERASAAVAAGRLNPPLRRAMPSRELERFQEVFIDMVAKLDEAQRSAEARIADERRLREEMQSLQRQIVRQERLAAIGVLVAGVAHELNNPLQAILGFADLLQLQPGLSPGARDQVALIQKESARASAIIRNLTMFGRTHDGRPAPVRLRDVIASVIELRQRKLDRDGIDLHVEEEDVSPVLGVFPELQQVLLNLVINAEQAMCADPSPLRRLTLRILRAGDRVRLEVEDSGPGVPPEHEAELFHPFFSTKPVGEGTGLGLSVSYGIIQAHGGTLTYRPASPRGAVFAVELPAASARARTA